MEKHTGKKLSLRREVINVIFGVLPLVVFCFFIFLFFIFFMAAPVAYGRSQARSRMGAGAAAAGLCHNHGNTGSEPHL